MKLQAVCSALVLLLAVTPLRAEKPVALGLGSDTMVSPGDLKTTPEMWFYEQAMRQYKDPKAAVRAKADFRDEQRQRRLESMKWFGLSNSRPRQQRPVQQRLLAGLGG